MKILAFTAGAANMYCGSCLRDNALAAELKRQGHDVILLPIYTPTLTDEPNVSDERVFLSGISVYLEQHSAFFRWTPWLLDRLWDSRWALKLASRSSIPVNPRLLGEMTVSMLRAEEGFQRKEIQKLTAWLRGGDPAEPPDIVTLPNSLLIGLARPIRDAVNRPVCCTLQGEDLFLSQLPEPYRTQSLELIRANVDHVEGFVAVSEFYAGFMCRYLGIPERKMQGGAAGNQSRRVSAPGRFIAGWFQDRLFRARGAGEGPACAGGELRAAASRSRTRSLHAGSGRLSRAGASRTTSAALNELMKDAGFASEFCYRGVLDRVQKIEFLRSLDVLSVPGTYDEPKGIFLLEAMASGVPVVQPRRGAFPEMLRKTGGGILVEPDDPQSLAEGILTLWNDRDRAEELGRRGSQGVREHYDVTQMANRTLEVYRSVVNAPVHA